MQRKGRSGQPPFGFTWKGAELVPNASEAATRILAFELFVEHRRKGTVARLLNEQGHRTRHGSKWSDIAVGRLLTCTSAKGDYALNRTTTDKEGKRVERPQDEWEWVTCAQIVDDPLWDEVQDVLAGQADKPGRSGRSPIHPFTGLIQCHCGGRMTIPTGGTKYVCADCSGKITVTEIEGVFLSELEGLLWELGDSLAPVVSVSREEAKLRETLAAAEARAQKAEGDIDKTHQLYLDGKISTERLGNLIQPLETRLAESRTELAKSTRELARLDSSADEAKADFDPSGLVANWSNLSLKNQREIVRTFVSRIVVGVDGDLEIDYPFNPNPTHQANHPNKSPEAPTSLKDGGDSQQMASPANQPPATTTGEPVYIRLPKAGDLCPRTGLTRSMLNELILPSERNDFAPPVKSKSLRKIGQMRGVRLILWESLRAHLASLGD